MLAIHALPAFTDNYIWLLHDAERQRCAVVDPGSAAPVQAWLAEHPGCVLESILITHQHADHIGGIGQLLQQQDAAVYAPALENIPHCSHPLHGEETIEVLGLSFQVLAVPGHTPGHIAYVHQGPNAMLFCGDTLFAGGCGRLFGGTASQLYHSLQRLAQLPASTRVYCTHEYTQSNLRFAQAVEPDNRQLAERVRTVAEQRSAGQITLPSSIGLELASNPFLRIGTPTIEQQLDRQFGAGVRSPEQSFALLRRWKDTF